MVLAYQRKHIPISYGVSHKGEFLMHLDQVNILLNLRGYVINVGWIGSADVESGHGLGPFGPEHFNVGTCQNVSSRTYPITIFA